MWQFHRLLMLDFKAKKILINLCGWSMGYCKFVGHFVSHGVLCNAVLPLKPMLLTADILLNKMLLYGNILWLAVCQVTPL